MRTIAFYNLKGGVGKTASAVNIAYLASQAGLRTLLWDLDPQGAAGWYLGAGDATGGSAKRLLKGKDTVASLCVKTPYDKLSCIPAHFSYRSFDLALSSAAGSGRTLDRFIDPFGESYSLAVLDCPPSLSSLAEQVFAAADMVIIPLLPTHLSLRTFAQLREHMKQNKLGHKRLYPFFTMVDRRRALHRELTENPPEGLKRLLPTAIPYASVVERMGERRAPLHTFADSHPAALAYASLWRDIAALLA